MNIIRVIYRINQLAIIAFFALVPVLACADNPAFFKLQIQGNFDEVLEDVKTELEAQQFMILSEENLNKGLENNKAIFGEDKWNTIGFDRVTAIHFCSLRFNQEVFNLNMDWSILCPFKLVLYSMRATPETVTAITIKPSYLLQADTHQQASQIGAKIEQRIITAIKQSTELN